MYDKTPSRHSPAHKQCTLKCTTLNYSQSNSESHLFTNNRTHKRWSERPVSQCHCTHTHTHTPRFLHAIASVVSDFGMNGASHFASHVNLFPPHKRDKRTQLHNKTAIPIRCSRHPAGCPADMDPPPWSPVEAPGRSG